MEVFYYAQPTRQRNAAHQISSAGAPATNRAFSFSFFRLFKKLPVK